MQTRHLPDAVRYQSLSAAELRSAFVLDSLFAQGRVDLVYVHLDRAVVGSAVPGQERLELPTPDMLRAGSFCERRELGILNIGGPGRVLADGQTFELAPRDCAYVGRGTKLVAFESAEPSRPAAFYLVSFPAHRSYPCASASADEARVVKIGSQEGASVRTLYQYIHPDGIPSCQLVMGYTELAPGSVWNTMPPHTHPRRSEIYLYFDLPAEQRVVHLMGEPQETRHLMLADRQAVLSPSWSLHSGAGTTHYRFVWAMGGENQEFDDMAGLTAAELE